MSPEMLFLVDLALKMALTAFIVVVISITVERSGPFIGALIAALPTAAGAAYIILAFEHPPAFIAASAVGSAAAVAAVSVFALAYTVLAQRHGVALSVSVAIIVFFVAAAALRAVAWTPLTAFVLDVAVFGVAVPLSWRYRTSGPPAKFMRSPWDIPVRALSAAVVVVIVTTISTRIGSFASGMFAVFPIVMACTAVILSSGSAALPRPACSPTPRSPSTDCGSAFSPCTIWSRRSACGRPTGLVCVSASPGVACCGWCADEICSPSERSESWDQSRSSPCKGIPSSFSSNRSLTAYGNITIIQG